MTIIKKLETDKRKALVECPQCHEQRVMDYYSALKRGEEGICQKCTLTNRNQTQVMNQKNIDEIDKLVKEKNSEDNGIFIIKFTDRHSKCLVRCKHCKEEYEIKYSSEIFDRFGCEDCTKRLKERPKKERSEYYAKRLDTIYQDMIKRTTRYKNEYTKRAYLDKNITVCQEWLDDRENFFRWAQENGYEETLTLDREDSDGDYEPDNCRWVTRTLQARNIRIDRANNTSGYKGVSKTPNKERWRTRIRVNSKEINIGIYNTALEAAQAYDLYVLKHGLEHTRNFA